MASHAANKTAYTNRKLIHAEIVNDNIAEDELKNAFVGLLRNQIRALGLTQTEAAAFMGIKQPDVSRLVSGQADRFTLARVFAFVRALGGDVDIKVEAKPEVGSGRMRLRVALEPV